MQACEHLKTAGHDVARLRESVKLMRMTSCERAAEPTDCRHRHAVAPNGRVV